MTRHDFWGLVAQLIAKSRGNLERFTSKLDEHLDTLAASEIEDFARHYAELQCEANTTGILEAATIIGCGASDDGFMDFRRWIVFQGETEFQKIVEDPDYLGIYDPKADPIEQWYCEYEPGWIYEKATGKELPEFDAGAYPNTHSDFDNPSALAKRYPKLWKRIQGKKTAQQMRRNRAETLFLDATLERIEADGDSARLVFSTGAEIRIRDYWPYYCTRYKVSGATPCYDDHPMVGQTVVSITTDSFPSSFFIWFDNRRKLSLRCETDDCFDFDVFENGVRIDA